MERAKKNFCFFSRQIYEHPSLAKCFPLQIYSIHLCRDLKGYLYISININCGRISNAIGILKDISTPGQLEIEFCLI